MVFAAGNGKVVPARAAPPLFRNRQSRRPVSPNTSVDSPQPRAKEKKDASFLRETSVNPFRRPPEDAWPPDQISLEASTIAK